MWMQTLGPRVPSLCAQHHAAGAWVLSSAHGLLVNFLLHPEEESFNN